LREKIQNCETKSLFDNSDFVTISNPVYTSQFLEKARIASLYLAILTFFSGF